MVDGIWQSDSKIHLEGHTVGGGGIYIYNVKNTYLENTHRIANFWGKTRMMENLSYLI